MSWRVTCCLTWARVLVLPRAGVFCEEQHPACIWNEWTRWKPFPAYPGGGCNHSQAFNLACFIRVLSVFPLAQNIPLQGKGKNSKLGVEFLSQACVRLTMEPMTLEKENSFLHNGAKGVAQEKESQVGLLRKRLGAVFRLSIDHSITVSIHQEAISVTHISQVLAVSRISRALA